MPKGYHTNWLKNWRKDKLVINVDIMPRFFNRIRKQLAKENKFFQYSRYAIGEILLVVIGILIALQVNNWNEKRKDNLEFRNILFGVVGDLNEDVLQITRNIKRVDELNKKIKSFLNHEDYMDFTRDSLERSLETFYTSIPWTTNNFDRLIKSDIIEYENNEELIKEIKTYYEIAIPSMKNQEEWLMDAVIRSDNFWRFQQNSYEFNYEDELHSHQEDEIAIAVLNRLLKSPTPRNILKINYRKNKQLMRRYERLLKRIEKLVHEIEQELNKED